MHPLESKTEPDDRVEGWWVHEAPGFAFDARPVLLFRRTLGGFLLRLPWVWVRRPERSDRREPCCAAARPATYRDLLAWGMWDKVSV